MPAATLAVLLILAGPGLLGTPARAQEQEPETPASAEEAEPVAAAKTRSEAELAEEGTPEPAGGDGAAATSDEDPTARAKTRPVADDEAGPRSQASPAAVAYIEKLVEALELELEVQKYETASMATLEGKTLRGHRERRKLRIDEDKAHFIERVSQFSRRAQLFPSPLPEHPLPRHVLILLADVERAYGASRLDVRQVKLMMDANQEFLETENWALRDNAVRMRDEIIEREALFARLLFRSNDIVNGEGLSKATIEEMSGMLGELDPESQSRKSDTTTLVLENEEYRLQVLGEVAKMLRDVPEEEEREEPAELYGRLTGLHAALIAESGLVELKASNEALTEEQAEIDAKLANLGVDVLSPVERSELVRRKKAIFNELTRNKRTWMSTDPEFDRAHEVIDTQDAVIQQGLRDLGFRGALFAHRYEDLTREYDPEDDTPQAIWGHLEKQVVLITEIEKARPVPSPLKGLKPPPLALNPAMQEALAKNPELLAEIMAALKGPGTVKKKAGGGKGKPKGGGKAKKNKKKDDDNR